MVDFVGELFHESRWVFTGRPTVEDAVIGAAGDYVEMEMIDELSGGAAIVVEYVIALGIDRFDDGLSDFSELAGKIGNEIGGALMEEVIVGFGDNETVALADGINVQKSQNQIILVNWAAG